LPTSVFDTDVQATFDAANNPSTKSVPVDGGTREIRVPFASPADWRDIWVYFLMLDRFNNPSRPPASTTAAPPIAFDQPFGVFQGGSAQSVGMALFTTYLLPFEVTSVLILIGIVGAVVLARKELP